MAAARRAFLPALAMTFVLAAACSTGADRGRTPPPSKPARPEELPSCRKAEEPALHPEDWRRALVDTSHAMDKRFEPPDLEPVSNAGFDGGFEVRAGVVQDLKALGKAAAGAGNPVGIVAAYRSYKDQEQLLRERIAEFGKQAALDRVARPGHSEHQLGTAVDFRDADASDVDRSWDHAPAGEWMLANAWRYGFVLSYPHGEDETTCYIAEPWHYRYFGKDLAADIHASGLTTREYLWEHR